MGWSLDANPSEHRGLGEPIRSPVPTSRTCTPRAPWGTPPLRAGIGRISGKPHPEAFDQYCTITVNRGIFAGLTGESDQRPRVVGLS